MLQLRGEQLEERRLLSVSKLSIPQTLVGQQGQTITVPIEILVTQAGGISLNGGDVALTYESTKFTAGNARLGTVLSTAGFSGSFETSSPGVVKFTASSGTGVSLADGTNTALFLVDFTIISGAGTTSPIDLEQLHTGTTTAISEDLSAITLSPAPTNNSNDSVDGLVTIQVPNTAPVAEARGPYTVNEGSTVSLSAASSSDAQQSTASLTFLWDLDGDNIFGETGAAAGHGNETGISPTYNAAGVDGPSTITVKVRVVDNGGLSATDSASISVKNVAPTSNTGGPYTVSEGSAITLLGTGGDPVDTLTFTWDLDRDGTYGETGTTASHGDETGVNPVYNAYAISGPQNATIRLKVTDSSGTATTSTGLVVLTNVAPTANAAGAYTVAEGSTVALSGTGIDVTDGISMAWDLDGDGIFGETGAAAGRGDEVAPTTPFTSTAPDGITVAKRYLDDIQYTFTWNASQGRYIETPDGSTFIRQESGMWIYDGDPGTPTPMQLPTTHHPFYTGSAFWDAAWPVKGWDMEFGTAFVAGRPVETSSVVFNASGLTGPAAVTVTLRVTDVNGESATSTATVQVTNVAPTANAGGPYTVSEGATIALGGTGSDPGSGVTLAWDLDGDATFGEVGVAAGRGNETGDAPIYNAAGLIGPATSTATLRVTDSGGASSLSTATISVTPSTLRLTSFTPMSTGFAAQFNRALDSSVLNLYDQGGVLGVADVTLVGASSGAVRGSLLVDSTGTEVTFIKSGGVLAPDTYTVVMASGTQAFKDTIGGLLDGNADLTSGDNYLGNFTIGQPASSSVVLSAPDFARGYGQNVNLPANTTTGIPITLSSGKGISGVDFQLKYDPTLLTITDVTAGGPLGGASVVFNNATPGVLVVTVNGANELSATTDPLTLVNIIASVPVSAPYSAKQILNLTGVHAYDASVNPIEVPSLDDDGIHVAAYFGDANGSQTYNSPDSTLAQRIILGANTGLLAYQLADPYLIVDITGNGAIQSNDVTLIQRAIVGTPTTQIPPHPGLSTVTTSSADPLVYIPQNLSGVVGESVSVPVALLVTEPTGITLAGADLAIAYDPTKLSLNDAEIGDLLIGFGLNLNATTPGVVRLSLTGSSALSLPLDAAGTLAMLHFTILSGADTSSSINLLSASDSLYTAVYDELGSALTLLPNPTDAANDLVDGRLQILSRVDAAQAIDTAVSDDDFDFNSL